MGTTIGIPVCCYVAFLRGVNVGGHRVKMDVLADVFRSLGFENVSTFIASGNVIFETVGADTAAELETRIEARLRETLGYDVATHLRTPAEVAEIVAFRPFADKEMDAVGQTIHVVFGRVPRSESETEQLLSLRTPMDDFCVRGRETFWLCRGKFTESLVVWPRPGKGVVDASTMRNITMLCRLAAKFP